MSAILSADRKYRYRLTRDLSMTGEGRCCFVMLNPSTADEENDDPTIRRCAAFARTFGCDRLEVVNLFAYRSTSPDVLLTMLPSDAIGPENDRHIAEACNASRIVICAWGNHGHLFGRDDEVLEVIRAQNVMPQALKINRESRQPAHPLYLRGDSKPIPLGRTCGKK